MIQQRTYGRLWLADGKWNLECEPHVAMFAKRVFQRLEKSATGVLTFRDDPATAADLEWFSQRFPLEIVHSASLARRSLQHREKILQLETILGGRSQPRRYPMVHPPREYQSQAAELTLLQGQLLLGDDVGLGKTVTAIATIVDPKAQPALVVTLAHLPRQWAAEFKAFAPDLFVHILKKGTPYELPQRDGRGPDVLITSYSKLTGWVDVLTKYVSMVVYDEVQDLRHTGTDKYRAAKAISEAARIRLGLSATPIYNYGGEIFSVLHQLCPDALGTFDEFVREWCSPIGNGKWRVRDAAAFGSYLREQGYMLRRTRADVGRELPPLQRITQQVDSDTSVFEKIEDAASQLARIILAKGESSNFEKMKAAEEFNTILRQATGIAKAPYVAAFVRLLIESGERVVLFGWHRAVYDIWLERLADYKPALYTGSESTHKKGAEAARFVAGDTPLLVMSLRAGAGLDGLQHCCRNVVMGELDWSPGVHEQCIGRVCRDGQKDSVAAYFMLSDGGSDPIIARTLGLKQQQIEGIRDLRTDDVKPADLDRLMRDGDSIKKLAEEFLAKQKGLNR